MTDAATSRPRWIPGVVIAAALPASCLYLAYGQIEGGMAGMMVVCWILITAAWTGLALCRLHFFLVSAAAAIPPLLTGIPTPACRRVLRHRPRE